MDPKSVVHFRCHFATTWIWANSTRFLWQCEWLWCWRGRWCACGAIEVPSVKLAEDQVTELHQSIDPLSDNNDFGIQLYLFVIIKQQICHWEFSRGQLVTPVRTCMLVLPVSYRSLLMNSLQSFLVIYAPVGQWMLFIFMNVMSVLCSYYCLKRLI